MRAAPPSPAPAVQPSLPPSVMQPAAPAGWSPLRKTATPFEPLEAHERDVAGDRDVAWGRPARRPRRTRGVAVVLLRSTHRSSAPG